MAIRYVNKGWGLHAEIARAGHRLWQEGFIWKADDETAVQAIIDSYVPLEKFSLISPRQIRLALLSFGFTMDQINAGLNSLPEPQKSEALIKWEYSQSYDRNDPLTDQVAQLLTWTPEQVDELWRVAAKL